MKLRMKNRISIHLGLNQKLCYILVFISLFNVMCVCISLFPPMCKELTRVKKSSMCHPIFIKHVTLLMQGTPTFMSWCTLNINRASCILQVLVLPSRAMKQYVRYFLCIIAACACVCLLFINVPHMHVSDIYYLRCEKDPLNSFDSSYLRCILTLSFMWRKINYVSGIQNQVVLR